jgi:hypothetical protein
VLADDPTSQQVLDTEHSTSTGARAGFPTSRPRERRQDQAALAADEATTIAADHESASRALTDGL